MKTLIVALLACLPLMAQTTPPPTLTFLDQVQGRAKSSTPMVLVVINGKVTNVQLDSSLTLNLGTTPPTLSASAAKLPTPSIETFQISIAASTITLAFTPAPNTLACYRSGVRMSAGFDFTQSGAVLTFGPGNAPQVGDLFTCDYQH